MKVSAYLQRQVSPIAIQRRYIFYFIRVSLYAERVFIRFLAEGLINTEWYNSTRTSLDYGDKNTAGKGR